VRQLQIHLVEDYILPTDQHAIRQVQLAVENIINNLENKKYKKNKIQNKRYNGNNWEKS
jgi:NADH dehydrogenase FAD-containing subunit